MSKFLGIRFVAFIICGLFVASPMQAHLRFDSLLIELDHVIANEKEYKSRKENYLEKLKEQLRNQNLSRESRYSIRSYRYIHQYMSYSSQSIDAGSVGFGL